jgi:hypothetical protein
MWKHRVSNRRSKKVKPIYSLKLESHNSSYICTAQNKEIREIDLMIETNKVLKQGNVKDIPILNKGQNMTMVVLLK